VDGEIGLTKTHSKRGTSMSRTNLAIAVSVAFCLMPFADVHSQEHPPTGLERIDAEYQFEMHQLELKMAELGVEEAVVELEKCKVRLRATARHRDSEHGDADFTGRFVSPPATVHVAFAPKAKEPAAVSPKTSKRSESGERSNGIAFSIVADATTVYLGEPLMLSFVVKNVSKHDVVLPIDWGFQCFSVEVTHGGKTYKEGNPFASPDSPLGLRAVTLAPGEVYTQQIDLLRLLRLVSPSRKGQKVGTCSIRAELTSSGRYPYKYRDPVDYRDCWKGNVKAKLGIEVLPPRNADDAAALKILRSTGSGSPEITDDLWSAWGEVTGRGDKRFSTILQKHSDSQLAPYCHLALAKAYAHAAESEDYRKQRDRFRSQAIEHCQAILKNYPKSRAVKPAKDMLEKVAEATEAGNLDSKQDIALHDARPETETTWSIAELPSPNVPDDIVTKLVGESKFRLSFRRNPSEWTLADVEKTNAQLNRTDISFVLNGVPIGKGNQGLANLRHLLSKLPRGTTVLTDHCLSSQANRWSERIREVEKAVASNGVKVMCDGAF
jgi:hypothetical protein